jgi:hypothetical protein
LVPSERPQAFRLHFRHCCLCISIPRLNGCTCRYRQSILHLHYDCSSPNTFHHKHQVERRAHVSMGSWWPALPFVHDDFCFFSLGVTVLPCYSTSLPRFFSATLGLTTCPSPLVLMFTGFEGKASASGTIPCPSWLGRSNLIEVLTYPIGSSTM